MIEWTKSPVSLLQAFDAALPRSPAVQRRKMFGYPAVFVDGNMATGLFQEHLIVRLPEARRAALMAEKGSKRFEPMPNRPMKEFVVVSPMIVSDPPLLRRWIREAIAYAASLPRKKKQTSKVSKAERGTKPSKVKKAAKVKKLSKAKRLSKAKKLRPRKT